MQTFHCKLNKPVSLNIFEKCGIYFRKCFLICTLFVTIDQVFCPHYENLPMQYIVIFSEEKIEHFFGKKLIFFFITRYFFNLHYAVNLQLRLRAKTKANPERGRANPERGRAKSEQGRAKSEQRRASWKLRKE